MASCAVPLEPVLETLTSATGIDGAAGWAGVAGVSGCAGWAGVAGVSGCEGWAGVAGCAGAAGSRMVKATFSVPV